MTNLISISDARSKLPSLVNKVGEGIEKFLLTVNSKPKAVLLSVEEFESLEETAFLAGVPDLLESLKKSQKEYKKGNYITLDELQKKYNL